jgi:hypothetical protein
MLPSKTVFVVGAGTSKEVGLPIGSELKGIIAKHLDFRFEMGYKPVGTGDEEIFHALRGKFPTNANPHFDACAQICNGIPLATSIDDFIDAHRHDPLIAHCGKLAIARSILEAEANCKLHFSPGNIYNTIDFSRIENTWYTGFFQLLSQQVTKNNLQDIFKNITLINFNYDRCIEHFLVHSIAAYYQVPHKSANSIVSSLPMFRPYGSVGSYFEESSTRLEFGSKHLPSFDSIVGSLRTFTEQVDDKVQSKKIHSAINSAKTLVFLGSAFHPNNMALLGRVTDDQSQRVIYATRKGISNADLEVVKRSFDQFQGRHIPGGLAENQYYFSQDCNHLFQEYRMALRR